MKILDLRNIRRSLLKRELQTITFYHMAHKKEEGTYHCNEKCSPRKGMPLLLIPEYSRINKGQRVPDRSKTAYRKPLVKCFLTGQTLDSQVFVMNNLNSCKTFSKYLYHTLNVLLLIKERISIILSDGQAATHSSP